MPREPGQIRSPSHFSAQCHLLSVRRGKFAMRTARSLPKGSPRGGKLVGMDARDVLIDAAGRPVDSARQVLDGLDGDTLHRMPDDRHSSIAWLLWHAARQADVQVAELAGTQEVWRAAGFIGRFALDRPDDAMGFGDSPEDVAKVRVDDPGLLTAYLEAVFEATTTYVRGLTEADLDDIVDRRWDPPVTRGVRLVSVIDDAVAHIAQAQYLRGLLADWSIGY